MPDENQTSEISMANPSPEDTSQTNPVDDKPKIEGLPENFDSVEDLAKSYKELQAAYTKTQQQDNNNASNEEENNASNEEDNNQPAPTSVNDYINKYNETGELTEEDYEGLKSMGLPKDLVDNYIKGIEAQSQMIESQLLQEVGGKEAWSEVGEWARSNLNEEEINFYNSLITQGDMAQAKIAMRDLKTKYEQANGIQGKKLVGNTPNIAGDIYGSQAQVIEDMKNPKYKSDPAFQKTVADKLARSGGLSNLP